MSVKSKKPIPKTNTLQKHCSQLGYITVSYTAYLLLVAGVGSQSNQTLPGHSLDRSPVYHSLDILRHVETNEDKQPFVCTPSNLE